MDCQIRIKTAAKPLKEQRVKTKWLRLIMLVLIPYSLFLTPSCKTNNWADWKTQNEIWLANNKLQPGVKTSPSGLQYKIVADPTPEDARPNLTSTISFDYTLMLINGNIIESGHGSLNLSGAIAGFAEGCHKIHNNGDIELYIPAYLGYDKSKYDTNDYGSAEGFGTEGTQSYIPPYSTLIYTIHLCSVTE